MSIRKAGFAITPALKELITETSRKCFGNLPIVPYRTGNKLLRRKPTGPLAVQHYIKVISFILYIYI
jgi:hypothetical protein